MEILRSFSKISLSRLPCLEQLLINSLRSSNIFGVLSANSSYSQVLAYLLQTAFRWINCNESESTTV